MAVSRPDDPDKPRRALQRLWLLLLVALGFSTLIATRKHLPAPHQPTKFEISQMAKQEAYRNAKYLVISQMLQKRPKSVIVTGFASDADGDITELGQNRFRCSGFFTARSPAGVPLRERWQCVVAGSQASWICESFQQLGWKRVAPGPAGKDAVGDGTSKTDRRE